MKPGDVLVRDPFRVPPEMEVDLRMKTLVASLLPNLGPDVRLMLCNPGRSSPNVIGAKLDAFCAACNKVVWRAPSSRTYAMEKGSVCIVCLDCLESAWRKMGQA